MVICLEQCADLHMAQLMPLPLTVSCYSKIQIGSTFLVPAHLGSPGQRAVKRVCVCVCVRVCIISSRQRTILIETQREVNYRAKSGDHGGQRLKQCSRSNSTISETV